jgi:hypothetical protein
MSSQYANEALVLSRVSMESGPARLRGRMVALQIRVLVLGCGKTERGLSCQADGQ